MVVSKSRDQIGMSGMSWVNVKSQFYSVAVKKSLFDGSLDMLNCILIFEGVLE